MEERKNVIPSAFPHEKDKSPLSNRIETGMSLRDYFAAQAMQGMLSNPAVVDSMRSRSASFEELATAVAKDAYQLADAMLNVRDL